MCRRQTGGGVRDRGTGCGVSEHKTRPDSFALQAHLVGFACGSRFLSYLVSECMWADLVPFVLSCFFPTEIIGASFNIVRMYVAFIVFRGYQTGGLIGGTVRPSFDRHAGVEKKIDVSFVRYR